MYVDSSELLYITEHLLSRYEPINLFGTTEYD